MTKFPAIYWLFNDIWLNYVPLPLYVYQSFGIWSLDFAVMQNRIVNNANAYLMFIVFIAKGTD